MNINMNISMNINMNSELPCFFSSKITISARIWAVSLNGCGKPALQSTDHKCKILVYVQRKELRTLITYF